MIYLDSKDAYRHEREQLDEDSSDLSDFDEGDTYCPHLIPFFFSLSFSSLPLCTSISFANLLLVLTCEYICFCRALSRIREARMSELKQQFQNNQRFRSLGHGEYAEISQVNY